jgi:hypothetical protein
MKKNQIMLLAGALLVSLAISAGCGKKQDITQKQDSTRQQNQPDIKKNESGYETINLDSFLTAGYMYWTPPAILDANWAAVITGEVMSVEKKKSKITDSAKTEVFGMVKIDKVLLSVPAGNKSMEKEKYIRTDALRGFRQGDKVLIYFVNHENKYAVKRNNVQKISGVDDELVGMTERFIKNGQNRESILKDPAEYKLWGKYDKGTVSRLMQESEEKEKVK